MPVSGLTKATAPIPLAAPTQRSAPAPNPAARAPRQALSPPKTRHGHCACGGVCPRCARAHGDHHEHEADRVAERVMRKPQPSENAPTMPPTQPRMDSVRSGGKPLPEASRRFFEPRFGADFSRVRIHDNDSAAASAESLHARAFTLGNEIVFGAGQFDPATRQGQSLIAHELAHVVQQSRDPHIAGQVQRKVVDDDYHVTCRNTRPNAVDDLRAIERDAIRLGKITAARIQIHLILHPLTAIGGDTPLLHHFRDVLWRRFHLDYNQLQVRAQWLPLLARRFELVAGWIERLNHRYVCGPEGEEPPGDCRTQPGRANAWTASGLNQTQLCESFWGRSPADMAGTILHEWFHLGFEWLGDCEQGRNVNNTVCYDMFARELDGTATPDDYADCCKPPADPLPELQVAP